MQGSRGGAVPGQWSLAVQGPRAGVYTEALRQKVAAHKAALIALLQVPTPTTPAATLTNGRAADVSVSPSTSRDKDVPSTPVKHIRRRSLAGTPPPHTGPLTNGQQGPLSFLYSVLRDGVVERGTFISQGIRTEPEALEFLRKRYPELRVQWTRLITHKVCRGCKHFTGGTLCAADQSPDHAAVVGGCGRYTKAGEL